MKIRKKSSSLSKIIQTDDYMKQIKFSWVGKDDLALLNNKFICNNCGEKKEVMLQTRILKMNKNGNVVNYSIFYCDEQCYKLKKLKE